MVICHETWSKFLHNRLFKHALHIFVLLAQKPLDFNSFLCICRTTLHTCRKELCRIQPDQTAQGVRIRFLCPFLIKKEILSVVQTKYVIKADIRIYVKEDQDHGSHIACFIGLKFIQDGTIYHSHMMGGFVFVY